jgi:hypothetical protein
VKSSAGGEWGTPLSSVEVLARMKGWLDGGVVKSLMINDQTKEGEN